MPNQRVGAQAIEQLLDRALNLTLGEQLDPEGTAVVLAMMDVLRFHNQLLDRYEELLTEVLDALDKVSHADTPPAGPRAEHVGLVDTDEW